MEVLVVEEVVAGTLMTEELDAVIKELELEDVDATELVDELATRLVVERTDDGVDEAVDELAPRLVVETADETVDEAVDELATRLVVETADETVVGAVDRAVDELATGLIFEPTDDAVDGIVDVEPILAAELLGGDAVAEESPELLLGIGGGTGPATAKI